MKTILIVDDKASAQRLIADYLTANGFRTVTANNGREALYVARHEKPDDHSWVWWDFHVENTGSVKCKIHLRVDIVGKAGSVVKSSDRSDTVDAGKRNDNIRLSTRMRTLDIADASKAEIRAEIGRK